MRITAVIYRVSPNSLIDQKTNSVFLECENIDGHLIFCTVSQGDRSEVGTKSMRI